jgi:hypothetical protein
MFMGSPFLIVPTHSDMANLPEFGGLLWRAPRKERVA